MTMAFGLFSGSWALLRGPRGVVVDSDGIQIEESGVRTSQHCWDEIGWATVDATAMSQQRRFILYDQSGKTIASISESLQGFEDLVAVVKAQVSDRQLTSGGDSVADGIRLRKARKSAIFMVCVAFVLILVSASTAWMTYQEQQANRLLETNGVEGSGTIDRLFVAPNGFTTRVEYTVTSKNGETGSRNVEIEPEYHAELLQSDAKTIPVTYVPSDPSIGRLQQGEVVEDDFVKSPLGSYGLSALVTLMCLFFLTAAVMQWNGWDLDLDSKTGKISLTRFGEGE